jgi:hypothetical protein
VYCGSLFGTGGGLGVYCGSLFGDESGELPSLSSMLFIFLTCDASPSVGLSLTCCKKQEENSDNGNAKLLTTLQKIKTKQICKQYLEKFS